MRRAVLLNIVDLVTVASHFGESTTSAAPQIPNTRHVDQIEDWVRKARTADDRSETFRRGIEILESLLRAIVPDTTTLLPNCPNPFNPETWISYQFHDDAGDVLRRPDLGRQPAGVFRTPERAAHWDVRNEDGELLSSGAYFAEMVAGDYRKTRRIVVLK